MSVSAVSTAPAPPARDLRANPWLTLVAVAFGLFMVGLDGSVVSIANAEIARDLQADTAELQWVTNSYLLALAATLILGGKLGDRLGRRTLYLVGVVGFTAASVAIGLVGSIEGVIAFRAVQGLFGAMLMPNTLALLRAVFPPRKFGMAVGIWAMISSVSTALGPIVGGLLVEHVNWESVFYINAPIGVIALVFGLVVLPQSRNDAAAGERFDVPGVVLLAGGLLAVVFGVVKGETWGWTSGGTLGAIGGGIVVLVLFGWYETRVAHPLLPMRLFRSPALTVGVFVTALNFFILLGVIFFVMLYLQNVRGFTPVESGVRTLPLSIASMLASPLGAKLTERFGPRLTMPLGMVLQAGAAFTMLAWSADSSYATMWPPFIALGLGVGMVMSASSDAIVGNAPVRDGGVAGGLQATSLQVGGALGTSVLVSIISSRVGSTLTGKLTDAGVPHEVADRLGEAKDAVAMGVAPVSDTMPGQLKAAVVEGSHDAFMAGVHTSAVVTGVLALFGALLAVTVLRGRTAVEVAAPAGLGVTGYVRGDGDVPVAGAAVTLISLGGRQVGRVVSGDDGAYRVEVPGAGSYVLVASAEGCAPQASTVVVGAEPVTCDVLLAGTSALAGTVRADGGAVEGAMVVTADVRGEVIAAGVTGADGGFGFTDLVPGPVTVAVSAEGYRPVAVPVDIAVHGVTRAEVELTAGARLHGVVTASGRALHDARVTLLDPAGNVVASAVTDTDGGYAFADLDGGRYTLTAAGYPPAVGQVRVGGAGVDGYDIELSHPES
ncbi:DHA2 family efflux MFS transporter permease subunit [Streptomyces roseirectus]|uniref:DHA2 family efflux MFS transporter permease subunit n=1 Tax=Streptomyces roseirectus TaxID=2768066 RepID=A0A7H0I5X7_9ACTN|nr:DHA2 family efflux MFS transporter permease subunit [Streptomyces roseirectus]